MSLKKFVVWAWLVITVLATAWRMQGGYFVMDLVMSSLFVDSILGFIVGFILYSLYISYKGVRHGRGNG